MTPDETLSLAREVAAALAHLEPLLIGAMALAVHGYVRSTQDVDFAVALPPRELAALANDLRDAGDWAVSHVAPDADDPLGGVITVARTGSLPVQIVNFDNAPAGGFPALVRDARSRSLELNDAGVPAVDAVDLILFKLYAGGPKSELDILELMAHTRIDVAELRRRAAVYRLADAAERVLARVGL